MAHLSCRRARARVLLSVAEQSPGVNLEKPRMPDSLTNNVKVSVSERRCCWRMGSGRCRESDDGQGTSAAGEAVESKEGRIMQERGFRL